MAPCASGKDASAPSRSASYVISCEIDTAAPNRALASRSVFRTLGLTLKGFDSPVHANALACPMNKLEGAGRPLSGWHAAASLLERESAFLRVGQDLGRFTGAKLLLHVTPEPWLE